MSALVDEVMRGKIVLLAPPGTWAAALVVPCFAIGVAAGGVGVALSLSQSLSTLYAALAVALALLTWPLVGQVFVISGRKTARSWLRRYARLMTVVVALASGLTFLYGFPTRWPLMAVAFASFIACDQLLGSRAYLAFSSFFSLKSRYRQDQRTASAHVLRR